MQHQQRIAAPVVLWVMYRSVKLAIERSRIEKDTIK